MDVYEQREFCYFLVLFFVDQLFWRFYCSCGNEGFLCGGKGGGLEFCIWIFIGKG